MDIQFEELDYSRTRLGELVLRRRTEPKLGIEVFEVKLGDEFLMSSLFTAGEIALANLALARLGPGPLDIAVGGLGLGYTAAAVLDHDSVRSLLVIEALDEVIGWHRRALVPMAGRLCADKRCEFFHGDFFALAAAPAIDPRSPGRRFHGILVDIDHSPRHHLDPANASFYEPRGLERLARHLLPGGVFALWSNDPPDEELESVLSEVFASHQTHVVRFHNPLQDREAASTVYVASTP